MSYQIKLSNGNILTTVPDTELVSSYGGLDLIGKNYVGFGTALNDNLVHMVEHFANTTPPVNPLVGQIWYDSVSNAINFWNGTQFKPISVITSSPTAPLDPQLGDEWYDSVNQQLNIWNGFEWVLVGPPNQGGEKEGFVVANIPTITGNIYYLQLYANNELLAIVSSVALTNPDIVGFSNIRPGWNFVTNPESAPSIIETGIYNVSELTIGDNDQLAFETDDFDNAIVQVNGGNIMIATNGNAAANTAAYTEWANGNIVGTVYFDNIVAGNYENLPASTLPGATSQVIYNNGTQLAGDNSLTILPGNVTARVNHLNVYTDANIFGTLSVTGNVIGNLNLTNALVANEVVASTVVGTDVWATNYHNLPPFSLPGSTGEVLFNNGGTVGATPALVIESGIVGANQLSVNSTANIASSITAGSLVTNTSASVGTTLQVAGQTTLNNGTGGQFTMPTDHGSLAGAPLFTDAIGGTFWGSVNLSLWTNSLTSNGYQKFPGGLIIQWANITAFGEGTQGTGPLNSAFPIAFPTACLWVSISGGGDGADLGAMICPSVISFTTSSVTFWWERNADHGGNTPYFWMFAIGY